MANKKREQNRARSSGGGMRETRSSGSYAHRGERSGRGEREGTDELPARGGSSLETKRGMVDTAYPSGKTPGGKEKVVDKTRGREEDED